MKYIVSENGYRELSAEELREMFAERTGERSYEEWMNAFCERKYNSDFAREMSRSVRAFLESLDDPE